MRAPPACPLDLNLLPQVRSVPANPQPSPARHPRLLPNVLFFPAASLYAVLVLPWSVLSMTGVLAGPAALSTGFGHAHEMLLGYALAVVAGNQLSRCQPRASFCCLQSGCSPARLSSLFQAGWH